MINNTGVNRMKTFDDEDNDDDNDSDYDDGDDW